MAKSGQDRLNGLHIPFPAEEYETRLAGLKDLMAASESEMDAVLITTDANHRYFTGHITHRWMHRYTSMFALLPLNGNPILIVTEMEASMCRADSWIDTIRTFPAEHVLQGVEAITNAIKEAGLEEGRIGTELGGFVWMRMPLQDFKQLQHNLTDTEFVDASPLMWRLRTRKSVAELAHIRQAVNITDRAYTILFDEVAAGMTEMDVYRLLAMEHLRRGAETPGSITLAPFVPGSICPANQTLRRHTDRILTPGELITQDAGGICRGYWSDYTRMYAIGRATDSHRRAYEVVYDCLQETIAATCSGARIADLVHTAKSSIKTSGYPEHADRMSSIGHAMGLEIIEPPFISSENDVFLEPGMILTIEPSIIVDGAFIMLEEDVLVTDRGNDILSAPASAKLPVL